MDLRDEWEDKPMEDLSLQMLIQHPALRLSPFEQQCAILWLDGLTEFQVYQQVCTTEISVFSEVKPSERKRMEATSRRRVRWALNRAAERAALYRPVDEAGAEFARVLVQCVRNRKEGSGPQDLIGLLPTIYLDDPLMTPEDYRKIVSTSKNYRNVVLRCPAMHAGMVGQPKRDALRHLAAGLG